MYIDWLVINIYPFIYLLHYLSQEILGTTGMNGLIFHLNEQHPNLTLENGPRCISLVSIYLSLYWETGVNKDTKDINELIFHWV